MAVEVVYHGHSCVELKSDRHCVQIDPFYDHNPLADVKSGQVHPSFILLSHAHFDHVDDAARIAQRTGAPIAANYEIAEYFGRQKLKTVGMNTGGGMNFPFGRATLTMAFHTSTFADGTPGGVAGGWVVEIGGKVIYFAGDTGLFSDMALIGKLWRIDLAFLPIGDCFTMGPAHGLQAAEMLQAKSVVPIHYNTFDPIRQDGAAFVEALKKRGHPGFLQGFALKPGERCQVP